MHLRLRAAGREVLRVSAVNEASIHFECARQRVQGTSLPEAIASVAALWQVNVWNFPVYQF